MTDSTLHAQWVSLYQEKLPTRREQAATIYIQRKQRASQTATASTSERFEACTIPQTRRGSPKRRTYQGWTSDCVERVRGAIAEILQQVAKKKDNARIGRNFGATTTAFANAITIEGRRCSNTLYHDFRCSKKMWCHMGGLWTRLIEELKHQTAIVM